MNDLISRLRVAADMRDDYMEIPDSLLLREAADALASLTAPPPAAPVSMAEFEKALDRYAANYHDRFADPAADRAEVLRLASAGVVPSVSREALYAQLLERAWHDATDDVCDALRALNIDIKE